MNDLINKSIYILREAKSQFSNPAVMWSTGKDSTVMLDLIRKTFGEVPFPVVHIDTGFQFKEIYEFRDKISEEWNLDMIVAKRDNSKFGPNNATCFECCSELKTNALKDVLERHKFDALIMSIRRDEHYARNLERFFSPRDKEFKWHIVRKKSSDEIKTGDTDLIAEQQPELWDLFQTDFGDSYNHVRVHPILHWNEIEVWKYIRNNDVPVNPLYFSNLGERYRSLGCIPCTSSVKSNAKNINEIIKELESSQVSERDGRKQDKENALIRLRALGYM